MLNDGFRYILLGIAFFCLTSICMNYIIINFTFICMKDDRSDMRIGVNGTEYNPYDYTPTEKSMILWAVAAGTIVGTFPVNYSYIRYGAKWPFFIAGSLSMISTVFIPLAAKTHMVFLIVLRFVQGLAYSADFAAIGIICVRWAPIQQTGTFISVLTSFTSISTVLTNPISGWLCDSPLGWKSSYYFHAAFCCVAFSLWFLFYNDDPQHTPRVSEKELDMIQKDKTQAHIERDSFVPYWKIITNKVILVVWFNAFTEMVTVTLLLTYAPIYFRYVLGYDVSTTGVLVSLSASIHLPLKILFGFVSDYMTCISERAKMWFFNTWAVGMAGVFCCLIGVFPPEYPMTGVVMFGAVFTAMGLNPGGFYKCGTLHSRQYAHFVLATIQFMKCIALFVGPATVAIFVKDESNYNQWQWVFWINGGLLIVANFIFCFIATTQPAEFTNITRESRKSEKISMEKF